MNEEEDGRRTRTFREDASCELGILNNKLRCLFWLYYPAKTEFSCLCGAQSQWYQHRPCYDGIRAWWAHK